jgi:hypothetical protein
MRYIFFGIAAIFIYAFVMQEEFLMGASFSPLLIIIGIKVNEILYDR